MADLEALFPGLRMKGPDVNLTLSAEQFEVRVKMSIDLKRDHFNELVAALEQQNSGLKTPSRCR
jgi:hypothetical protein